MFWYGRFFGPMVVSLSSMAIPSGFAQHAATVSPAQAYAELVKGNERFAAAHMHHPHESPQEREALLKGQKPHTVVLGCSDSRVPPEILFDEGLGDLFSVRVAGEALSKEAIASIEYAVTHLGSSLVLVLGHTHCGAVRAALESRLIRHNGHGHFDVLLRDIRTNIKEYSSVTLHDEDDLMEPVSINVSAIAHSLQTRSSLIAQKIKTGDLAVVRGVYQLSTGRVQFLDPPPHHN